MNDAQQPQLDAPQLRTLLLTDLCDSTELVEKLGDARAAELFREHDALVLDLQQQWRGRLIDRSDGLLLLFERPIDGLGFALDYQRGLEQLGRAQKLTLRARAGLHVGEVLTWRNSEEAVQIGAKPLEVEGLAKPTAARLMALARPGQILVSAVAESLTHRAARELGERGEQLLWKSYGRWRFKGMPTAMEIYEVGEIGRAQLRSPKNSPKAWRDIPLWRRPAALVAEVALVAAIGVGSWVVTRPAPALAFAERDWVVVGDMRNLTGDPLLDDSLQQAFRISLEQSRYVNVVSDIRARRALELMRKDPAKEPLTIANAAEVAVRLGVRYMVLPSVSEVGGRTRVSAEVINPRTLQSMYVASADGKGVDSAMSSVDSVVQQLRSHLGEDPPAIDRDSLPLSIATTGSLDALRSYSLGQKSYTVGDYAGAASYFERASKLDPEFALAWLGQMRAKMAIQDTDGALASLDEASKLKDRLPPREAMYLEGWGNEIHAPSEAVASWEQMASLYPDFFPAQQNAAIYLYRLNRYADALVYARNAANSKNDLFILAQDHLGRIELALGQDKQAQESFNRSIEGGRMLAHRQLAAVFASRGEFAAAKESLAKLPSDPYADIERISIAIDEADTDAALASAVDGINKSATLDGYERFLYLVPEATAELMAGDKARARQVAAQAADRAISALAYKSPEHLDQATLALAAALVAQRAGDSKVGERVLAHISGDIALLKNRVPRELVAVVRAEQQRLSGEPQKAIDTLTPYLDDFSRFQTRVAAMHAYAEAGKALEAEAQTQWLLSRRGMAYAELQCGYCMQPMNVMDVSQLARMRPAERSRVAAITPD